MSSNDGGGFCNDDVWESWHNDDNTQNNPPALLRKQHYNNAFGNNKGGYGREPGQLPQWNGPPHLEFRPPGPPGPPRPFGPPVGRYGPYELQRFEGPFGEPRGLRWGQGFCPNGPPTFNKNKVIQYLLRCGVPKANVKNLPRDLLDLIEPQRCGLCGQTFESATVSRGHYVSKNHQKNVKKYLMKSIDSRMPGSQEAPLKSRELYCELCDVQITSKVHADSHYSGRSHRAIVEGRKPPKNPALHGSDRRVNQLIRREKKFLPKSTPKEEESSASDPKTLSPDLYCEICKTTVTNTEQMRSHLNGKKHLTKEKQFILKTMRGDVEPKEENAPQPTTWVPTYYLFNTTTYAGDENDDGEEQDKTKEEPQPEDECAEWSEMW